MSLGGESVSFGGEPAKPKKKTNSSAGQTTTVSFGGEPVAPKQTKTNSSTAAKPAMVSSATGAGPDEAEDEMGLIKLGNAEQDH